MWIVTSGFSSPKNIKEAVITFRLTNSWISSNNMKSSGIKMVRWDGSKWDQPGIPANVTATAPGGTASEGAQPVNFFIIIAVFAVIGTVIVVYLKKRENFKKGRKLVFMEEQGYIKVLPPTDLRSLCGSWPELDVETLAIEKALSPFWN